MPHSLPLPLPTRTQLINGRPYKGPEVDVWACGVILYALLCGMLPFDDDLIPNLYKKIKGGLYHLPDYLSPGASHLISSILVVDPNARITIPEIRRHPWFRKDLPTHLAEPQADVHGAPQARARGYGHGYGYVVAAQMLRQSVSVSALPARGGEALG